MEFVDETKIILRKYRKTEVVPLVAGRAVTILLGVLACLGYFVILIFFLATTHPVEIIKVVSTPTIPVPDLTISFNYKFNVSCQFRYTDNTNSSEELCAPYLTQPCNQSLEDGKYYAFFTSNNDLTYNRDEKRNGVWFTIFLSDTSYDVQHDLGMQARAYDSAFDPRMLDSKTVDRVNREDPNFFDDLNNRNTHIIGFRQNNWMFISRKIKKKMKSTFANTLGIPPIYHNQPFIHTLYESVTDPISSFNASSIKPNSPIYGHLFVGTFDWFTEEIVESSARTILDALSLMSGFYALVFGIYVCLFGASPILPWGLCQSWCLRKQVKESLAEKYPKYIPLVDPVDATVEVRQRITYLEEFLKDYVVEVDVLEETEETDEALTAAEKDELATGSKQSLAPVSEE